MIEPLADVGADGRPVAVLAAEIPTVANGGVSKDLTSVTWKLRPGVKWSDGSDLTSADVVFTWKFIADAQLRNGIQDLATLVKSVEAIDRLTVRVTYAAPRSNVYTVFGSALWEILQERQFTSFTGTNAREAPGFRAPIGTGPYRVKELRPNEMATFEINDHYRDPARPFFKEVAVRGAGDASTALRAVFETGEADFAAVSGVDGDLLKRILAAPGGKGVLNAIGGTAVERLALNRSDPDPALGEMRSEPSRPHPFLTDLRVRQALAMAIDRKAIAELFSGGHAGEPVCNIVVGVPAYTSKNTASFPACTFDLAQANRLLDEAGWAKGADGIRQKGAVRMKVVFVTTVAPRRQAIQALIKDSWSKVGVETELKSVLSAKFFDNKGDARAAQFFADVQMYTSNWVAPDVGPYLRQWTTAEIKTRAANWTGANYERWSNPEYDDLSARVRAETDEDKRAEAVVAMNDLLVRDVVGIPLVTQKGLAAYAKSLKGYEVARTGSWTSNIANWSK